MHRLLTKTSGSPLVAVIGGDCSYSSRLISKDSLPPTTPPTLARLSKMEQRAAEGLQSHSSYLPASLRMAPALVKAEEEERMGVV